MPSQRFRLLRATPRGTEVSVDALGQRETVEERADAQSPELTAALEDTSTLAAALIRDAEAEAIAIRQRAYIEGRSDGEQDGRAAARAEVVEELQALQSVALQAAAIRESILRGTEAELIELTVEAARAVLGEAITRDPELVVTSVRRALDRATGINVLRVRVNPEDASIVSAYLAQAPTPLGNAWVVSPEGAISVGGCLVDIEGGEIDARLDVQLETIITALRELVPSPHDRDDMETLRAA